MKERRFVYVLRSSTQTHRYYTGLTSNPIARLHDHNAGGCSHTVSGRPWELIVTVEFAQEERAVEFEKYLKSGSGRAFSSRHFR